MLHFSQDVIVREMAGILDMAALGASEAPADLAFSLKGALRPAVRDDDVEYEGMCRCLKPLAKNHPPSQRQGPLAVSGTTHTRPFFLFFSLVSHEAFIGWGPTALAPSAPV